MSVSIEGFIYIIGILLTAWLHGSGDSSGSRESYAKGRPDLVEPSWSIWIFPILFGVMWPIFLPIWIFNKFFNCNDPRVSAHLMTLTPGVHWVPHSPETDAAVRYCKTGSIARPHGVHARAIRTGAARCIPLLGIGRSAPLACSAPACRA